MRFLAPSMILALAALGGVALAQPVEDPWGKPPSGSGSWFEPAREQPPARLPVEAVLYDPWASSGAQNAEPPVVPATPAKHAEPVETPRSVASFDAEPLVVDPWATARSSAEGGTRAGERGAWANRVVEIVDPWKRARDPGTSDGLHLVRDPWAR